MNRLSDIQPTAVASGQHVPNDYHGRAKWIIERFVRTAVLIDDDWPSLSEMLKDELNKAETLSNEAESEQESVELEDAAHVDDISDSEAALFSNVMQSIGSGAYARVTEGKTQESVLNANANRLLKIQDDFVRRGVIFTGFKYTKKDEERGPKLAKNADILILDWNFAGDNGAGAMKILQDLRKDGQLRFVCIFTDQPDLVSVKSSILKTVFQVENVENVELDFPVDNFIFTLRNKAVESLNSEEVSQVDTLFDDAIGNIAGHYSGFVQLSVLEMSSHHRRTMMTHLKRFSPDFDSAILSETAQEDSPVDMGACLRSLLIDEWRVALEASALSDDRWMLAGGRALYAASLKKNIARMTFDYVVACTNAVGVSNAPAILRPLFEYEDHSGTAVRGFDSHVTKWLDSGVNENLTLPGVSGKKNLSKLTFSILFALTHPSLIGEVPTAEQIYKNVMRLEALFSQQLTLPTELMQGTILKYNRNTYFICITPLCDTARYEEGYYPYTFLQADRIENSRILDRASDYVVFIEKDEPICLHVDIKRPHVFEIDHLNRMIQPLGGNDVLARYRALPPERDENEVVAPTAEDKHSTQEKEALPEEKELSEISVDERGTESSAKTNIIKDMIPLTVAAQLRNDFFLMFSAAAASNSSRVGVNRVEYIRFFKAG